MRTVTKLGAVGLLVLGALQFFRPSVPFSSSAATEVQVPHPVNQILEKDCYSCHSDERHLAWFDEVMPAWLLVRHDILTARSHLNFSTLGSKPEPAQRAILFESVNMVRLGAMPLPDFTALHRDANVTPDELATLQAYLAPWSTMPPPSAVGNEADREPAVDLASVLPELNGLAFDPGFESWKPISFTDRGDNNTLRFILGNDIAVKAARSGQIAPWPDGARFAKIAWQQEIGPDGLIHPGNFIQVEFMVKDARLYKATAGWGWGRWRGLNLKPYGEDAGFTGECVGCHMPLRGADYVYTLPMTRAEAHEEEVVNGRASDLPQSLPWQPLDWGAITMQVDRAAHTMGVLFGNREAMQSLPPHETHFGQARVYPPGSVLALVTWSQRDDPHWFGARIPDVPLSVEFVSVPSGGAGPGYRRFEGVGLTEKTIPSGFAQQRANSILNLTPAILP